MPDVPPRRRKIHHEDLPFTVEAWDAHGNPSEMLAATCNLMIGHAALEAAVRARPGAHLTLRNKAAIHRQHRPTTDLMRRRRLDEISTALMSKSEQSEGPPVDGMPAVEVRALLRHAIERAYVTAVHDARDRILDAYDEALAGHEPLLVLAAQVDMLLEPAPAAPTLEDEAGLAHEPSEGDSP